MTEPTPISRQPEEARYSHVAKRMLERGSITWDAAQVAALEAKIKKVQAMVAEKKHVPHILPTKLGSERKDAVQFYRVLIAAQPHTFVWSTLCNGLISYMGQGEFTRSFEQPKETVANG